MASRSKSERRPEQGGDSMEAIKPLIVLVPHGNTKAPTRPPAFYDETYAFLVSCGIPEIK